jgi:hypothetical protein
LHARCPSMMSTSSAGIPGRASDCEPSRRTGCCSRRWQALGVRKVESLADLLREFNHQNAVTVAYKAFYNRLARPGFAEFMRRMLTRLVEQLSIRIVAPEGHTAIARFDDIVIQDGSSFALKKALSEVFFGRFTTVEPAAVEVHATYSGCSDEVRTVAIASDSEAERHLLPEPSTLSGRLLLADRGYPSVEYLDEVREHGGSFIMRISCSHNPWVRAAWVAGKRCVLCKPVRLSEFMRAAYRPSDGSRRAVQARQAGPRVPGHRVACPALSVPLAGRAALQGVEVLREPAQVQHRQRAHRRRPDLGEPLCGPCSSGSWLAQR